MQQYKCIRCRAKLIAPSVDHLCDDCREIIPRRDGLPDLTSIHRRIIKTKPFLDENGKEIKGELPFRPIWDKPEPNELWAIAGMDDRSKRRNNIPLGYERVKNG